MVWIRLILSLGIAGAALCAQTAGIPPEWETRKLVEGLVENARKLEPILTALDPVAWKEQGAPDAYVAQKQSVLNSLAGLKHSSGQLAAEPTKLSYAVATLFRLDAVNVFLNSLAGGVKRYQNPALAELLIGVADENSGNKERLKEYILELAETREGEYAVLEKEAHRCLENVVKEAPPVAPTRKAKP